MKLLKLVNKKYSRKISKNSSRKKRLKFNKTQKKSSKVITKIEYDINSPHNTNEYLIQNQSTPFYEENEEEDFDFPQYTFINLDNETKNFSCNQFESTNDESEISNIVKNFQNFQKEDTLPEFNKIEK